jgi:hypothetical protein
LFDVVQTRSTVRFAENHLPTGWNLGESWPQAVLILVVDQNEKTAIAVIEWIDTHQSGTSFLTQSDNALADIDDDVLLHHEGSHASPAVHDVFLTEPSTDSPGYSLD